MDEGVEMISTRILIACILLTQVTVVIVMADNSLNNSNHFWIKINPVPQSYIGETINITGTTNLPEDEKLEVKGIADQEYQYRIKSGVISEQLRGIHLSMNHGGFLTGNVKSVETRQSKSSNAM